VENERTLRPVKALAIVADNRKRHHRRMGSSGTRSTTPDPFSSSADEEQFSSSVFHSAAPPGNRSPVAPSSPRHILPSNLATAIKQLDDQELDRLFSAVVAEQKRRGKSLPSSDERRQRKGAAPALKSGQVNAVRAAFKAGVTPSRIARQFGLLQADVNKALASDEPNR
jgi:hypothetical protein